MAERQETGSVTGFQAEQVGTLFCLKTCQRACYLCSNPTVLFCLKHFASKNLPCNQSRFWAKKPVQKPVFIDRLPMPDRKNDWTYSRDDRPVVCTDNNCFYIVTVREEFSTVTPFEKSNTFFQVQKNIYNILFLFRHSCTTVFNGKKRGQNE